jgi:hypothetical protein
MATAAAERFARIGDRHLQLGATPRIPTEMPQLL